MSQPSARQMRKLEGIVCGMVFGELTVLEFVGRNKASQTMWRVSCTCGSVTTVLGTNLNRKNTTHCNDGRHKIDHGYYHTAEYAAWKSMKWRCSSKNPDIAKYYADRGICVCQPWKTSFMEFLNHIGKMPANGMQVDRIDNDRGYEPGNVRWATRAQQMANTRQSVNVTIGGRTECLSEWARLSGIPLQTVVYRFRRGWPVSELLSHKKRNHRIGRCA